jgi:Ca2+-binding EF-hand superfamily protein
LRLVKKFLPDAIFALGWQATPEMLEKAEKLVDKDELNFEGFVAFIRGYRALELEEYNRRAGFSESEVEKYRDTFNKYDKSGDGDLTIKELIPLLTALGREPRTVIQREKLTTILSEIDEDGSGEINFLEFLQLMRRFTNESDAEQLRKEKDIIKRTKFTPEEVNLWRDIFLKFDDDNSGAFDVTEGKTLLQAVGVNLNERVMHDRYLSLFRDVDEDEDGLMDFPEFLLLMKKCIDLDFGGLQTRMGMQPSQEETPQEKKKSARASRRTRVERKSTIKPA